MSKYRAIKTVVDNITFASKKEAARYAELKLLQRAGEIELLELQPRFPIEINGVKVCTYVADFGYFNTKWDRRKPQKKIIEDVKGMRTPMYRLKRKLVKAVYNVDITEI